MYSTVLSKLNWAVTTFLWQVHLSNCHRLAIDLKFTFNLLTLEKCNLRSY